jgi:hypothetical protein
MLSFAYLQFLVNLSLGAAVVHAYCVFGTRGRIRASTTRQRNDCDALTVPLSPR